MSIKNKIFPQANIYSSKILFERLEIRNQKRMTQIIKRRNLLLSKNRNIKEKSSEQMITPSTQEISITNNNISNISKSTIKEDNNDSNILLPSKPRTLERFLSSSIHINKKESSNIDNNNNINVSDEDLSEKEVNISNLNDKNNCFDNENKDYKNFNIKTNIKHIQKDDNNKIKCQRNQYAIEFLSSNLDSFIDFKNKLVAKARYNKNYFTLSYSQALFLDYYNFGNTQLKREKNYNYEVDDIIKEENESFSPMINKKSFVGKSANNAKNKKNLKKLINLNMNKIPNKSFFKEIECDVDNDYNLDIGKRFNKKELINKFKLKIPKVKLTMEIRNKRKLYENKEYKTTSDFKHRNKNVNHDIPSEFLKYKIFFDNINKKENNKNINKRKSKKIKTTKNKY